MTSSQPAPANGTAPTPSHPASPKAALEALDAELSKHTFATTLTDGQPPWLTVTNRYAQLREDVYADDQCYWWPWGQPIAAIGNPKAAASKVSYVLAAVPGTAGD